jgi:hypothetical protein
MWMWKDDRTPQRDSSLGGSPTTFRAFTGAFFRLHTTRRMANSKTCNGGPTPGAACTTNANCGTGGTCSSSGCTETDSTDQIGCLAGRTDVCSVGFAGRGSESASTFNSAGARVGGVQPTVANVQALVDPSLGTPYPLARKLYLSSITGFNGTGTGAHARACSNSTTACTTDADCGGGVCIAATNAVTGTQHELAQCYVNPAVMTAPPPNVIAANGFVALPSSATGSTFSAICEDFNDTACLVCNGGTNAGRSCTAATAAVDCPSGTCVAITTNHNACSDNSPELPSN